MSNHLKSFKNGWFIFLKFSKMNLERRVAPFYTNSFGTESHQITSRSHQYHMPITSLPDGLSFQL